MKTQLCLSNVITINGPCEPLDKIREDLTIDNPKYANTIKYSKWGKTKVPPTLTYFHRSENGWGHYMPRGYLNRLIRRLNDAGVPYSLVDKTHTCPDMDINFTGQLKSHQVNAVKDILSHDFGVSGEPNRFR